MVYSTFPMKKGRGRKNKVVLDMVPKVVIHPATVEGYVTRRVIRRCDTYPALDEDEEYQETEPDTEEEDTEIEEEDEDEPDVIKRAVRALRDYGCISRLSPVQYQDPDEHVDYRSGDRTNCSCTLDGFNFRELDIITNEMSEREDRR
jgi:hypothetical protein